MPETALQGLAGVSLTGKTLGPRKPLSTAWAFSHPASCYVIQKTVLPPGNPQALERVYLVGTLQPPGPTLLSPWADDLAHPVC